jgi:hypothetical protein
MTDTRARKRARAAGGPSAGGQHWRPLVAAEMSAPRTLTPASAVIDENGRAGSDDLPSPLAHRFPTGAQVRASSATVSE